MSKKAFPPERKATEQDDAFPSWLPPGRNQDEPEPYDRPPRSSGAFRIVMLSGLTNLVLMATAILAAHLSRSEFSAWPLGPPTAKQDHFGPWGPEPNSTVQFKSGPRRAVASRKGPLALTVVTLSSSAALETAVAGEASAVEEPEQFASAGDELGRSVPPILSRDRATGRLQIRNFGSLSMTGGPDECLNIGYGMVSDAGASPDSLEVIADTEDITIAKVCAANGTIMITCRNEQIAVSPRRPRPDDQCKRTS